MILRWQTIATRNWPLRSAIESVAMLNKSLFVATATAMVTSLFLLAPNASGQETGTPVAGDYIVAVTVGATPAKVASAAGISPRHVFSTVLPGFSASLTAAQARTLATNPAVTAMVSDSSTRKLTTQTLGTTPPDRMYVNPQWGLDRLDQRTPGGDGTYSYDTTGQGVTVFVLDSGVRAAHTDLGGRAAGGYDVVDIDADPADCTGHGTEVASVIGGVVSGVAKKVNVIPVRVLGCDGGRASDLIAGLDWAVSHKPAGPSLVNISIGGPANDLVDKAVTNTVAAGLTVVVAAGDQGDACETSPARAAAALTVGGTDYRDWLYLGSATGPCVDLFAPADVIAVAGGNFDTELTWDEGTSLSAAFVSGIVARTLQQLPTANPATIAATVVGAATPSATLAAQVENTTNLVVFAAPPAAVTLPGAPKSAKATTNDAARTGTLTWTPPASNGGQPITGYRVSRDGVDSRGTGAWATTVPADTQSQTFSYLKPGATYTFSVQAITVAGTGPAAVKTVATTAVPGKPVIGTAYSGTSADAITSVAATWQPPTSGGRVDSYLVTAINKATGARTSVAVAAASRDKTVVGLVLGAKYVFEVVAVNASGKGPASALSNQVTAR